VVGRGVDRHRFDPEIAARPDHPYGDLAAVRDEDLLEHVSSRYRPAMPEFGTDGAPPGNEAVGEVTARPWSGGAVARLGTVDSTNRYALDAAAAGR